MSAAASLRPMAAGFLENSTGAVFRLRGAVGEWVGHRSLLAGRILWKLGHRNSNFVLSYLSDSNGVEIGASAHNDYALDAINVDRYGEADTIYRQEEWRLTGRRRDVDVVAPGDKLPFGDDAVDFVFASHVLEHFPDPIKALKEWVRVARTYVVLVIPHRDRTFDRDREVTPVEEIFRRHEEDFDDPRDLHWSVWTLESFLDLCERLGFRVIDSLDPDDKFGDGFIVVLDATTRPGAED
jgi:SAM-dependent methyltransferase